MGNRARRRAALIVAARDQRLTPLHLEVLALNLEMDRRGFVLCEAHGQFHFERRDEWVAARTAA